MHVRTDYMHRYIHTDSIHVGKQIIANDGQLTLKPWLFLFFVFAVRSSLFDSNHLDSEYNNLYRLPPRVLVRCVLAGPGGPAWGAFPHPGGQSSCTVRGRYKCTLLVLCSLYEYLYVYLYVQVQTSLIRIQVQITYSNP